MKMGSTTRPLGRCLLRGGGEVRVDLGKYQAVCHRGQRSSPEDEAGGSSPPRPTILVLTCGNSRRLSPSTAAGAIRRLGTPVSERIPALLSSDDYGSSVERAAHGQLLWRVQTVAAV